MADSINITLSGTPSAVPFLPTAGEKAALAGTGTPSGTNKYVTNDTLDDRIIAILAQDLPDAAPLLPSEDEKNALAGSGTPSGTNKYVTQDTLTTHTGNTSNPHSVTKTQVGLGNCDNTSDANKPVSTAQQAALDLKVDIIEGKALSANDYTTEEKDKLAATLTDADFVTKYKDKDGGFASVNSNLHIPASKLADQSDLNTDRLTQDNLSDELISQIAGTTAINPVIADGSITDIKLNTSSLVYKATSANFNTDGTFKTKASATVDGAQSKTDKALWDKVAANKDANGKQLPAGMASQMASVTAINRDIPSYVGQIGKDADGNMYIAVATTGAVMWQPLFLYNRDLWAKPVSLGTGNFTYPETRGFLEIVIANSINYFKVYSLPPNVKLKIGWVKWVDANRRMYIHESSDNGATWTALSGYIDLTVTETDGITCKRRFSSYGIEISINTTNIAASNTFNYYIQPYITAEGNLIFSENVRASIPFSREYFKITSDDDVTRLGGKITGGTDFTTHAVSMPMFLYKDKGTVSVKCTVQEDVFKGSGINDLFSFLGYAGDSISVQLKSYLPTAGGLWNQAQTTVFKFIGGTSQPSAEIRVGASDFSPHSSYNINQGVLFALRYKGTSHSTDSDLRVTMDGIQLKFHYGDGTVKAYFTLSFYATIEALISAIEIDGWCSENIEVLFRKGLSLTPSAMSYVNSVKMISSQVRMTDYTKIPTPTSPPADPTGNPDWATVWDAFPVYIEQNAINREVELTISYNSKTIECYIDGNRMGKSPTAWTPFTANFVSTFTTNGYAGIKIKSIEYKHEFTSPAGLVIPLEAHVLTHGYADATGSLEMSLKRLSDMAKLFQKKGWKCITVDELNYYKEKNLPLPGGKAFLMIVDDYYIDWYTTKTSRDLLTALGIKVCFDVIGSTVSFTTDRDLLQSINSYGWNVHTHCKWHTNTDYMKYDDLKQWFEDAIAVFEDNFLPNTVWTIPFSVYSPRIWKLAREMGYNLIFTGTNTYSDVNYIPDMNQEIYQRIPMDDASATLSSLETILNYCDIYE